MLFNSYIYIFLFLPITLIIYYILNKFKLIKLSKGWLILASLFFYSYWKLDYLPLILFSMVFNYSIGSTLLNDVNLKINKKFVVGFGIIGNVLLLGYFKYFNFLLDNLNALMYTEFNYMKIVLPLAISFFTFQQIAYLVDSYKGETKEYDFLNYALFVTFFPQLIAGPIVHHREMMPQFAKLRNKIFSHKNLAMGIFLFSIGLFKKVVLADNLSTFVAEGFLFVDQLNFFESWLTIISYAMQIYFDFSGYTDMALGVGMMFNIFLPQNFNSPYKAVSIQDFWRRWHMTLSRFLKNYVYIPLGGNRICELKIFRNLFATFLLGGLWHGANWTFVVWGALHGFATVVHRLWEKTKIKMPNFLGVIITFLFVCFTWAFFRADSFDTGWQMTKNMIGVNGFQPPQIYHGHLRLEHIHTLSFTDLTNVLYIIILSFGLLFAMNSTQIVQKFKPNKWNAIFTSILLLIGVSTIGQPSEFLYFNF